MTYPNPRFFSRFYIACVLVYFCSTWMLFYIKEMLELD